MKTNEPDNGLDNGQYALNHSRLMVHATNVSGLGALQVISSLLSAFVRRRMLNGGTVFMSSKDFANSINWNSANVRLLIYHRTLPNAISRVNELLIAHKKFTGFQKSFVFGDIPLCGVSEQTVLVHQPHLIHPSVNPFSSRKWKYKLLRWVFSRKIKYAKNIIVQTGAMKQQLLDSYPNLADRTVVIPQPAPDWIKCEAEPRTLVCKTRLSLFYPAAGHPHKNHVLIRRMEEASKGLPKFVNELIVTLGAEENKIILKSIPWVKNVGRLKAIECLQTYRRVDALFFPSLMESYGLPIVEAMTLGLPIVCADLPYARWLCEGQAIYFDPMSTESAWKGIFELHERLSKGWIVDWSGPLAKLPKNWDTVADGFANVMGL